MIGGLAPGRGGVFSEEGLPSSGWLPVGFLSPAAPLPRVALRCLPTVRRPIRYSTPRRRSFRRRAAGITGRLAGAADTSGTTGPRRSACRQAVVRGENGSRPTARGRWPPPKRPVAPPTDTTAAEPAGH